jgi:hypothetical protein
MKKFLFKDSDGPCLNGFEQIVFIYVTVYVFTFFIHGATAPSGPGHPHYRGFTITLRHTPHSVGILWTSDQPDAETST